MLTSILEPGVYLINGKTYKAGDAIPMNAEEQAEFAEVCKLYDTWVEFRTKLLNACHAAVEPYDPQLAKEAHAMKLVNLNLRYRLNLLIAGIELRLGGLLPIFFDSAKKTLTVANRPDESIVYTIKFIGDTLGMPAFEFPRAIASALVGKEQVFFDYKADDEFGQISVFGKTDKTVFDKRARALADAIFEATKKDGPQAMSLIVYWYADKIRIVNADASPTTTDPNSRPVFKAKDILTKTKPQAFSLAVEKADPTKITFSVSHIEKGKPPIAIDVIVDASPGKKRTGEIVDGKVNFTPTRMTPETIDELLA